MLATSRGDPAFRSSSMQAKGSTQSARSSFVSGPAARRRWSNILQRDSINGEVQRIQHHDEHSTHLVTYRSGQSCVITRRRNTAGTSSPINPPDVSRNDGGHAGWGPKKSCPWKAARPVSRNCGHLSLQACQDRKHTTSRPSAAQGGTYSFSHSSDLRAILHQKTQVRERVREQE